MQNGLHFKVFLFILQPFSIVNLRHFTHYQNKWKTYFSNKKTALHYVCVLCSCVLCYKQMWFHLFPVSLVQKVIKIHRDSHNKHLCVEQFQHSNFLGKCVEQKLSCFKRKFMQSWLKTVLHV